MYVSDERWQGVVLSYLKDAAGVILQPSLTDGVLWEIDRTIETTPREHILLSMVNYQGRPDAYERLRLYLLERHGVALPRTIPYIDRPCFVHFGPDGSSRLAPVVYYPTVLWPLLGNAINIKATLGYLPVRAKRKLLPAISGPGSAWNPERGRFHWLDAHPDTRLEPGVTAHRRLALPALGSV